MRAVEAKEHAIICFQQAYCNYRYQQQVQELFPRDNDSMFSSNDSNAEEEEQIPPSEQLASRSVLGKCPAEADPEE